MAAAETARLIAELSLRDKLTPGVNKALGSVAKLDKGMSRVGRGAGQLSSGLTRAGAIVGTAVAAGFTGAAKAAIDWQDAFQGVVKTVDEADLKSAGLTFRDLELSLRKMSTEMPNAAQELASIAEAAGAMGIKGKDIAAFTKQVAILASTTDVSAQDAAIALGQMTNVIGLAASEFDNFAASLVYLGNQGTSFESSILEIARRAGGAAKSFGIAKKETLGWAAAAANLGLNQELAGTALQKVFFTLLPKYAKGAKDLQKITGKTAAQLKKAWKTDASGALEDLIQKLSTLPKAARLDAIQDLFGKGSGIGRLVNDLASSYDKNLVPSLRDGAKAWDEATAAQAEFDKRNATVRSSIARLKNGLIDAAVTVGEGFTPALGRASDKLAKFLGEDVNRNELKKIGEEIGKSIDAIDWQQVLKGARDFVGVMRVAFDWAKRLYDLFNALPTEIKGATAGLLALNKLSGGLVGAGIGNIAGGLGETIARSIGASLPGALGKAFVQPVFVTNWAMMGGGGAAGLAGAAGKGMGALSKLFLVGEAIGLVAAVVAVQQEISAGATKYATEIRAQTATWVAQNPSRSDLERGLAGVEQGINDLQANPLLVLVQGDALEQLKAMRAKISGALKSTENNPGKAKDDKASVAGSLAEIAALIKRSKASHGGKTPSDKAVIATLERNRQRQAADARIAAEKAREIKAEAARTTQRVKDADASIDAGASKTAQAAIRAGVMTSTALKRLPAPRVDTTVNVYVSAANVTKSSTSQTSWGPGTGSSGADQGSGLGPGGP